MDVKLIIKHDQDTESPNTYENWKLVSFNSRHTSYGDPYDYLLPPDEYGEPVPANIGIRRKLKTGTAFILSYFEHGNCVWGLKGETHNCQWDTARIAGILFWEGKSKELPKSYEEREEWARSFLKEYTEWCNGNCYYFRIEDMEENILDSCGGFIGDDGLADDIKGNLSDDYNVVAIEGEASCVIDLEDFQKTH